MITLGFGRWVLQCRNISFANNMQCYQISLKKHCWVTIQTHHIFLEKTGNASIEIESHLYLPGEKKQYRIGTTVNIKKVVLSLIFRALTILVKGLLGEEVPMPFCPWGELLGLQWNGNGWIRSTEEKFVIFVFCLKNMRNAFDRNDWVNVIPLRLNIWLHPNWMYPTTITKWKTKS